MKLIQLTAADTAPGAEERYKGRRFVESDLEHIAADEDTTVLKPDGSVLCIILKRALSAHAVRDAFPILRRIELVPKNRATATKGVERVAQGALRKDGSRSKVTGIGELEFPEIRGMSSAIIGYYDRNVRWPYCRATAFNLSEPEKFEKLLPFVREVNALFKAYAPERFAAQEAMAARTDAAWIIPGTVFSTITVNKNYDAATHVDAGDLRAGFGVMCALRAGTYEGGVTYWPAFKTGVSMDTGDVCLADVHEWHGVTKIRGTPGRYERVSCVFYLREKMCRCGTPTQELERAKARQLGQPLYDKEPA